jgi:hypothetical protein
MNADKIAPSLMERQFVGSAVKFRGLVGIGRF